MLLGKLNITPNCPDLNKHCKVIVWFTTTCDDGSTDNVTSPEKYFIKKKSIIFSNFRSFERNASNFFLKYSKLFVQEFFKIYLSFTVYLPIRIPRHFTI